MKKLFSVIAIALLITGLGIFGSKSAIALEERELFTSVTVNTSGGDVLQTSIATTTIIPGRHAILGYTVCPSNFTSRENYVALYDGADVAMSLFGEVEARTGESITEFYPLPRPIHTQLTFRQGPETIVTIYYVRLSP